MTDRKFYIIAVFGFIFLGICNAIELNSNEAEARTFLQQTSEKIFNLYDKVGDDLFKDEDNVDFDLEEMTINSTNVLVDVIREAKKFDYKNFKDEELKFAFETIANVTDLWLIGGERYWEIYNSLITLESWTNGQYIEDYNNESVSLAYNPDVVEIIKTSDDLDELKYYWSAWRYISAEWASENFNLTLEGLKDAANLSGLSPLEFWLQRNNITEMEHLLAEIRPLYLELHALVRNLLRKKFGKTIIKPNGLIPDYLFEQVLEQAWSNGSILEEMFSLDNIPSIETRFESKRLYQIADEFFEKLGFEKYPQSFWKDRIKMSRTKDNKDCKAYEYHFTPNIYLEYCEKITFMDFFQAYAHMGNIYYAKEMKGLPAYYFDTYGLEDAIGKAIILSSSTHQNLISIGMILDSNITEEVEMNRLIRKCIQNILYIPMDFVHAKLMADLLSGNIDRTELNEHYWHLMDKYAGVGPPEDHEPENNFDLPYNFFEEVVDNSISKKFETDILSYQIQKRLCELSGQYPKEPLHLCDINGSKTAGDVLKKMMRLGTSKPYREVLATMFPENPTVSAESLLEYYHPVMKLLAEKNKEAKIKTGWKSSASD